MRFNVQDAAFAGGAKADAIRSLSATISSGLNTVHDPLAVFNVGDFGKAVFATDPTLTGVILPLGTITGVVDAHNITVSTLGTSNVAGACLVYGTDDTAAFQAAFAAAVSQKGGSVPGAIGIPSAGYLISARWYRNNTTPFQVAGPSVIGDGAEQSQLYMAPGFTIPGDGTPVMMEVVGRGAEWRGFKVDGCYQSFATAADQHLLSIAQTQYQQVRDVQVTNVGLGTGSFMFNFEGGRQIRVDNVVAQNLGIVGTGGALRVEDTAGLFSQVFGSNTVANIRFVNCKDRSPVTTPLCWIGGGADEGSTPAVSLVNSDVHMIGVVNFCGIDPPSVAFDLDGTSYLLIEGSNVGRFEGSAGQCRPLNAAAGAVVHSIGTTWRGTTGGPTAFMVNKGTFIDGGGNRFRRFSSDTVSTDVTPAVAFDLTAGGHMPVVLGSWFPFAQVPV